MFTVISVFEDQVKSNPDAPAVIFDGKTFSFRDLDDMADSFISQFPDKESPFIGIVMDHGVQMIAAMLAVLKSGAAYVPAEPDYPPERIRFMMEESRVGFVITSEKYLSLLTGFRTLCPDVGVVGTAEDRSTPDGLAYVLYTSGTTGNPKGVMVANRNICHYVRAFQNEFHPVPGDIMLQYSVCSFDIFVEEVYTTLLSGATLAIPTAVQKKNISSLLSFIDETGVTIVSGFPYLLLEMNRLPRIPGCLRLLISGGDVLRAKYVDRLLPQVEVYNTYGPSETTVCASYYRCSKDGALADGTFPIGKAVLGVRMVIMNDRLEEVPAGETGEICILGGGVSRGYLGNNPESENFVTMPDGQMLYRSGDLGYLLPDGNTAFLRRKDRQIMVMGKRVECDEVESVLCSLEEVEDAVVSNYADDSGLSYLVAYLIPRGPRVRLEDLKVKMRKRLTEFMIPEFFVTMSDFPLTANGKVNRKALPVVLKANSIESYE